MKCIAGVVIGMCISNLSAANVTPTNRAEVVFDILEQLACDITDDFGSANDTQEVDWVSWTQDGFFGKMSTAPHEQMQYKQVFDSILEQFATSDWSLPVQWNSPVPKEEVARVALGQIRDMSYTNALPIIRKWALNPSAPYRDEALSLCFGWSNLDNGLIEIANAILTNSISVSRNERMEAFIGITDRIGAHINRKGKDVCFSNAVHMLYQSRDTNIDCAPGLDAFLVAQIPGYVQSSNRMELALRWLESTNCTSAVRIHCISITNQLMNVPQPLQEIRSLRGL